MKNQYIVVEGIDGSGKSTAIKTIAKFLFSIGIYNIKYTHEPGSTPLAEKLRQLIKYNINNEIITNKAELLMIYAARIQLVENVIKPALEKGYWVIGDRHDLSSQAYQGGGRGISTNLLKTLKKIILNNFQPNLTLFLDVKPELGMQRIHKRNKLDRIEKESINFFYRTRNQYIKLTHNNKKIITINANKSIKEVQINIRNALIEYFNIK